MKKQIYAGLFLVTLATLMFELLLTRIFSVTMWYHFAFMAISVAMFGMTAGAMLVYFFPAYFSPEQAQHRLASSSLGFSAAIVLSILTHLSIPFLPDKSFLGFYSTALTYVVVSAPFVFSGVCVCLALTKFPQYVSKLYAADLAGAAAGCLLLPYVITKTDGLTTVVVTACLASTGALFFAVGLARRALVRTIVIVTLGLGMFAVCNAVAAHRQHPMLSLRWVRGVREGRLLYERWNSFSRVTVQNDSQLSGRPFAWGGLSSACPADVKVKQLWLTIDSWAGTVLTEHDGNTKAPEYLKFDMANMAHYIRHNAKVLVIGVGGGRDILSALAFNQKEIVGVEINDQIMETLNGRFGDFAGHLDRISNVTLVTDEARSYIARQKGRFDIIVSSLIDTYAASSAGAFAMTENSLYTVEAWKTFLEHLTPDGVLTFSRWYWEDPSEMYRLTVLAASSLKTLGITNPRDHTVVVRKRGADGVGVGTMLVCRRAFAAEDVDTMRAVCDRMGFEVIVSPTECADQMFADILSGQKMGGVVASYPMNIAAPTDDKPYFFLTLRFRDALRSVLVNEQASHRQINVIPVVVLMYLAVIVVGLTVLCFIVPLTAVTDKSAMRGAAPLLTFFAAIGLGFMFVEVSQMQRLMIFLGHPTYALVVVLFTLLLASGLGSYLTSRVPTARFVGWSTFLLSGLLVVLISFGVFTPRAISVFSASTTAVRIGVAISILFPLGLFMGMAFPLGMRMASTLSSAITPWLWGVNGAASVCASVFAVVVALSSGIAMTFWTGCVSYLIAGIMFLWVGRGRRGGEGLDK